MKVVILAGGLGTRLSEETSIKPKPMVEIGGKPIIWHIMKIYSHFGFKEFVICLGYKGYLIKDYFLQLALHDSDFTVDLTNNNIEYHRKRNPGWKITFAETGEKTMTGGRIKRIANYVEGERFMLTYGDGVGAIPLDELLSFHKSHNRLCTVTAVQPSGRFGVLKMGENDKVDSFYEKRREDAGWINAGYFVCEPGVLEFIDGDETIWEHDPLEKLASSDQLMAFKHRDFWKPMDTLKDKMDLNDMWIQNEARWKLWE